MVFFLLGLMFLPLGAWIENVPNPFVDWTIFILSAGIPWTIGYWLMRIGFRSPRSDSMSSGHD